MFHYQKVQLVTQFKIACKNQLILTSYFYPGIIILCDSYWKKKKKEKKIERWGNSNQFLSLYFFRFKFDGQFKDKKSYNLNKNKVDD